MSRPPIGAPIPRLTESRLKSWPDPPSEFDAGEVEAWARLGRAVMAGAGLTEADLPMAETWAQVTARLRTPGLKTTVFASLARLKKELEIQLGMSPAARKGMVPPDPENPDRKKAEGLLDAE